MRLRLLARSTVMTLSVSQGEGTVKQRNRCRYKVHTYTELDLTTFLPN